MNDPDLDWLTWTNPITTTLGARIARRDLSGRTVAIRQHITPASSCVIRPFLTAGARVRIAPCSPDSTDDATADYLASIGADVRGHAGMTSTELTETLEWLIDEPADALCDMGGELIAAYTTSGQPTDGAIEATTTGIQRLLDTHLPFPVLDWNTIQLKDRIHNRHHVGAEAWPAFTAITGLSLYGRNVVVIGFGPVGQGVAQRARELGAMATVVDHDPIRSVQALHQGCRIASLDDALQSADIIITATGKDGVVGRGQIETLPDGAILANVGHSHREIDVSWLDQHPRTQLRRHLERFNVGDRQLYLLNRGSLLNLAAGIGTAAVELFDPFGAVMMLGIDAILNGLTNDMPAGLHPYPAALEATVAQQLIDRHRARRAPPYPTAHPRRDTERRA